MRTIERKARLLPMVESPDGPSVRIVAGRTAGAESPIVNIIRGVAGLTAQFIQPVGVVAMAGLASHHRVETEKWKGSQIVIEGDALKERHFAVTIAAIPTQFPSVHVVSGVADDAAGRVLRLLFPRPRMT